MIRVRDLQMTYRSERGSHHAIRSISLDIPQGQLYTLLGPSGCGKTTTMRCIAGLERPDSGEISIGGEIVFSSARGICTPPNRRGVGMVFQSYAIWPHMNVFENVAFPLRRMRPRLPRRAIEDRALAALALVKLDGLRDRPAPFLSGGQQQRLALARALVAQPRVLLLDEPLSNLDAQLREEMRLEIRRIVERLQVTTLFVTHEQIEALTMSDRIGVMCDGRLVQEADPVGLYQRPAVPFVASFLGKTNLIPAQLAGAAEDGLQTANTAIGPLHCLAPSTGPSGGGVVLAMRPEDFILAGDDPPSGGNVLRGAVQHVSFMGEALDCQVRIGELDLRVRLAPASGLAIGDLVTLCIAAKSCRALPVG